MNILEDYKKYRWFYTLSKKLVVGGKSAEQNDDLLTKLKASKKDFIIMHTAEPGSPFCVILTDKKDVTKQDIEEAAIFTGCFSRAWRSQKKKTRVDTFDLSQLNKSSKMKIGTWCVVGNIKSLEVNLELILTEQEGVLRAVPRKSVKRKSSILLKIHPGKIDKQQMILNIQNNMKNKINPNEILAALPAGGVSISKN
ncbi:MAG: NFACT RNA binding domain-containing protein [Nanoarchaeota archaeon]|nr:NFACT RNA binding domain-containing protein [Nanoarchaeota archaeon]